MTRCFHRLPAQMHGRCSIITAGPSFLTCMRAHCQATHAPLRVQARNLVHVGLFGPQVNEAQGAILVAGHDHPCILQKGHGVHNRGGG